MVSFTADHHFHIGQSHLNGGKPCQDFALSGILDGAAYAIAADGCSSGGMTDVGARILALAAANAIRHHWVKNRSVGDLTVSGIAISQNMTLFGVRDALGLGQSDLLATSTIVYLSPEGGFIHLQGDGVVALKYRTGQIAMFRYEWAQNMPYYPAYALDERAFIQAQGGSLDAECASVQYAYYEEGKELYLEPASGISLRDGLQGFTKHLDDSAALELEYVAVFTDGVTQFKDREWTDIVRDLLAFKSTEGDFAKRRLGRVVKDAQKSGNTPMDDVGYAVIRVQLSETEVAP